MNTKKITGKTNAPSNNENNNMTKTNYECLFNHLQPYLPQMIFWKDKQLRYQGCNDLFSDLLNLNSAKPLIGKTHFDSKWKVPTLTEALLLVHEQTALQYRAITCYRTTLKFPKHPIFIARINIVPLLDLKKTSVQGVMGVITEIKEEKSASSSSFLTRHMTD